MPAAVVWQTDPAAARRLAIRSSQPLLIYATAPGSPGCILQDEAFEDKAAADALSGWVCLRLDITQYQEEALRLELMGAPSLRASTVLGKVVAQQDGYMPAAQAATWLAEARRKAVSLVEEAGKALSVSGTLKEAEVAALVDLLADRQPEVREAAIERLAREPEQSAGSIVKLFLEAGLGARLSCLEILKVWQAPVGDVDPWRPETIEQASGALSQWLARGTFALGLPTRAELDKDFEILLEGDEERAAGAMVRLARAGSDLLSEVRQRLANETRDVPRERLTMLRYRLVMPARLVREQPAILLSLVSSVPAERARAVEMLDKRGGTELEALLLELFQDPDPLVRELALRALRRACGASANKTLAELLADPQPNVRAQVLKELAQSPSAATVKILAEYVKTEADEDLVVHAVRAVSASKSIAAAKVLVSLAGHSSWQVRSEIVEALGKYRWIGSSGKMPPDAAEAIRKLLADSDSFVASKAVEAVKESRIEAQAELAAVAERMPEIAPDALTTMATSEEGRAKAVPFLRKFTKHADAAVRAAALEALVECTQTNIAEELRAAFQDADTRVRQAAASSVSVMVSRAKTVPAEIADAWRGPLENLLSAEEPRERCAGAAALVSMKITEKALPVLKDVAKDHADLAADVAECLQYLRWEQRKELFEHLISLDLSETAYQATIEGLAEKPTRDAAPYLWAQVDKDQRALGSLSVVQSAILRIHLGEDGVWNREKRSPEGVKLLAEESIKRLDAADERIRMLALSLLCVASANQAIEKAESYFAAAETSPIMRRNALAVLMLFKPRAQPDRAVTACSSEDDELMMLGLGFLAEGSSCSECQNLQAGEDMLYVQRTEAPEYKPAKPPKSLTPEVLTPLLSKKQPYVRACAAYLLARLGDAGAIRTLAAAWRESQGSTARNLLTDAITTLNDDASTPFLEELYNSMDKEEDSSEIREFYWKIRDMKGPKVLALRKKMRDEVGMEKLR